MKATRLAELKELLQSAPFAAWWTDYTRAQVVLNEARARHEELASQAELMELRSELAQRAAMDAFSQAGVAEELAARGGADAQVLENQALGLVGRYEEQRFRSSDLWYRLGGLERTLEVAREAVATADREKRAQAEASLKAVERQQQTLQVEYAAEDRKRELLWAEVEQTWARSFERSLLAHEDADHSRRVRREAERLFKEAEERRTRARQLRADADASAKEHEAAEQRLDQLLGRASDEFACAAGRRFLYWRRPDDKRSALAVALASDREGFNIEVKALEIYAVGPQRGAAFLEPARDGLVRTVEEGDRRFEEYLLGPREGIRPGGGGPPQGSGSGAP